MVVAAWDAAALTARDCLVGLVGRDLSPSAMVAAFLRWHWKDTSKLEAMAEMLTGEMGVLGQTRSSCATSGSIEARALQSVPARLATACSFWGSKQAHKTCVSGAQREYSCIFSKL